MEITFYPFDFEYKIKQGKVLVYLYSRTKDGKKICVIHEHQPFFYALYPSNSKEIIEKIQSVVVQNYDLPAKVISVEIVEKELIGKKQSFLKIYVNYPKAVPLIAKEIESWGITCYERDVLFIHRYLRDLQLLPMMETKAQGEYIILEQMRLPVFEAVKIEQSQPKSSHNWKILSLDIETYALKKEIDSTNNPILMVGFYGIDSSGKVFEKVITWKKFTTDKPYIEFVQNEKELLEKIKEIILNYDPDILTGYFSDGFDLPYIKTRARVLKVSLDIGSDYSELFAPIQDGRDSESKIAGTLHIDILKFIKYIFGKNLKTQSYSLDAVSQEILGHKKEVVNLDTLSSTWDQTPQLLEQFCSYNLHDARLTYQLCAKLLYDMIEFTKIVGLPLYDVIRMRFSRLVESYIMKRAMEFNVLAPNKPLAKEIEHRQEESIEGGFVYEPIPGIYKDLVVFDFRSLYPTIIVSHNIGPESFCCACCKDLPHVPDKEEYWFCQKEKKFLPTVLSDLINRRAIIKKEVKEAQAKGENATMLEARSYALKILANSFYGYLGFFGARWYCLECAASTTAYARNYIKQTFAQAQKIGFKMVYGDTDSCFFELGEKTEVDAIHFMRQINEHLPGDMELELQGYYPRGIFVAIKGGSEKGAKKKYALISKDKQLKIVGFETVRRNWSEFAKKVQEEVLHLILEDKTQEAVSYIKAIAKKLKEGSIPLKDLIIKTQITRDLASYSSIGPHVHIARSLEMQGERILPGTLVEYIIVKGSGLVRERAKSPSNVKEKEYDASYYLHHQLVPAIDSIFAVLGYKEDELVSDSSQVGLGKFF